LLFYNGARWYQPSVGRYAQPDGLEFANPFNLYAYAFNNPIAYDDPSGYSALALGRFGAAVLTDAAFGGPLDVVGDVIAIGVLAAGFSQTGGSPSDALGNGGTVHQGAPGASAASGASQAASSTPPSPDNCGPNGADGNDSGGSSSSSDGSGRPVEKNAGIFAQNGTKVSGFTRHGIDRAVGDTYDRAGTTPKAILDALKSPLKIESRRDAAGLPAQIFFGRDARVIVNPDTGQIVSVNPLSSIGAH